MIAIESDCVDCPAEMDCLYEACPYYRVVRYYCDRCGSEDDVLYWWGNEQLCLDCVVNDLEEVEPND